MKWTNKNKWYGKDVQSYSNERLILYFSNVWFSLFLLWFSRFGFSLRVLARHGNASQRDKRNEKAFKRGRKFAKIFDNLFANLWLIPWSLHYIFRSFFVWQSKTRRWHACHRYASINLIMATNSFFFFCLFSRVFVLVRCNARSFGFNVLWLRFDFVCNQFHFH